MSGNNIDGKRYLTDIEQEGELAGRKAGRVWIRNNEVRGYSAWRWIGMGNLGAAANVIKSLMLKTAKEIDEYYERA